MHRYPPPCDGEDCEWDPDTGVYHSSDCAASRCRECDEYRGECACVERDAELERAWELDRIEREEDER